MDLSENYWDNRYIANDIGWDIGHISRPLKAYIDQLTNKGLKILIPGGGNSYEAEYLFNNGFNNVFVADISQTALNNLQNRVPHFPKSQLLHQNFFDIKTNFDLIIEQTFFCALQPNLRPNYVLKSNQLLNPNGKIIGLLFNVPLNDDKPPFGGSRSEYIKHFNMYFDLEIIQPCYNSIPSRAGRELFIKFSKK